jgi:hypothetical protein
MGGLLHGQCCCADGHPERRARQASAGALAMDRANVHVGLSTSVHAYVCISLPSTGLSADLITGDMSTGGPYYSPFLVTVLCAHAARFEEGNLAEILISRARLLLGNEIHKPSAIPTVQALLQLSARDLAYGNTSQGWLYSGMAFRMVSDLGLHHSSGKILSLGNLTPEDLEIRRRLFWSCYFWDKTVSLYLGRTPVLTEVPLSHSPELCEPPLSLDALPEN